MEPYRLPRPNAPFVQGNGAPTVEWYNWLRGFENLFNSSDAGLQAQITQIAYALGSPDGTVANIPPIDANGLPTSTMVVGQNSVVSFGTLADGIVTLTLQGDQSSPGESYYYGTNGLGAKGWHLLDVASLSDVDLTTTPPTTGDALVYDGTDWVPGAGGGSGVLPLVTGEVPPVLVYADDGSLIYAPASY